MRPGVLYLFLAADHVGPLASPTWRRQGQTCGAEASPSHTAKRAPPTTRSSAPPLLRADGADPAPTGSYPPRRSRSQVANGKARGGALVARADAVLLRRRGSWYPAPVTSQAWRRRLAVARGSWRSVSSVSRQGVSPILNAESGIRLSWGRGCRLRLAGKITLSRWSPPPSGDSGKHGRRCFLVA